MKNADDGSGAPPETVDLDATVSRVWGGLVRGTEDVAATVKSPAAGPAAPATVDAGQGVAPTVDTGQAGSRTALPAGLSGVGLDVLRLLGEGGMGVVYAARQDSLGREVAVKVPRPGAGGAADGRFVKEARVTGALDHPNIVPVHDLGHDASGNLYMAMRLVRGRPWRRLLHPLSPDERVLGLREHLEILLDVTDAVAFAHARGIVHRDLKPDNVMVGDFGEVLVMDWGVALERGEAARGEGHAVDSAGTPAYMAPEMATGDLARLGPASDVYLLGAILYEVLTGSPPHRGADVWEALRAAARGDIEPVESRAPGRRPPAELARIAYRALERDPALRHPDVAAFQRDLRGYLAHEESLRLVEEGRRRLADLERPGEVPLEGRYAAWSEALAAFAQALHLWPQNEDALESQARAADACANEALDRGDTGLAASHAALLGANPRADAERLAALRSALRVRKAAARRGGVVLAATLVLLAAAVVPVARWRERVRAEKAVAARTEELDRKVDWAWEAARNGRAGEVGSTLATLRSAEAAVSAEREAAEAQARFKERYRRRGAWLETAHVVLLWRDGLFDTIATTPAPRDEVAELLGVPPPPGWKGPARGGTVLPCAPFLARPEGRGGALRARLEENCQALPRQEVAESLLWGLMATEARTAGRSAAFEAFDEEWEKTASAPPLSVELRRAVTFDRLAVAAWRRGERAEAERLAARVAPFALDVAPFGPPQAATPGGRLEVLPDASWVALDPSTGARRWRSLPLSRLSWGHLYVPVADGSAVVASGMDLVRLDGATGAVSARLRLDGQVLAAWPDPRDRARLQVVVSTDPSDIAPRLVSVRDGRVEGKVFPSTWYVGAHRRESGVDAFRERLAGEARARLGLPGAKGAPDPRVRAFVAEALREAMTRDPDNPDLPLAALEEGGTDGPFDAGEREALAARVVSAPDLRPYEAAFLGTRLERLGFREEARGLYARGAATFVASHGNADLSTAGPALVLRKLGAELFRRGEVERALELVEEGRRFGSFLAGDDRFYRRYATWLRARGREGDAVRIEARLAEAAEARGDVLLPARFLVALDVALYVLLLAPALLAVLLLRAFFRSRATRLADLHAQGWRTTPQRALAFLTHPFERLRFFFLSYAPRAERGAIALLGAVVLLAAAVVTGNVSVLGDVVAAPLSLGSGYAGSDTMWRELEARQARFGPRASTSRLLAEGAWSRGESDRATEACRRALSLEPDDPVAGNNAAVLAEGRGEAAEARRLYERAARAAAGAVARVNLARLDGDASRLRAAREGLAHRDRLRVDEVGTSGPVWALAHRADLFDALSSSRSVLDNAGSALLEGLGRPPGRFLRSVTNAGDLPVYGLATLWLDAAGVAAWLSLAALLWVFLPVRPVRATGSEAARGRLRGAADRVGRGLRRVVAVVGLAVPGLWDLLVGRAALGAGLLLAFLLAGAAYAASSTGGWVGRVVATGATYDYFEDVPAGPFYPGLDGLREAALVAAVALLLFNVASTWRRARREGAHGRA